MVLSKSNLTYDIITYLCRYMANIIVSTSMWLFIRRTLVYFLPNLRHNHISTIISYIHNTEVILWIIISIWPDINMSDNVLGIIDIDLSSHMMEYPIREIQILSCGYYIQDMLAGTSTAFALHHIVTIFILTHLHNAHVLLGFLVIEITNIPIYTTYLLKKWSETHKSIIYIYMLSFILEIVMYIIRCVWLPISIYKHSDNPLLTILSVSLFMGSLVWFYSLLGQIPDVIESCIHIHEKKILCHRKSHLK